MQGFDDATNFIMAILFWRNLVSKAASNSSSRPEAIAGCYMSRVASTQLRHAKREPRTPVFPSLRTPWFPM